MDGSKTQQVIRRTVDELATALEAGQSDHLKAYLAAMGRFHRYSWGNVLLIHMAFPSASHVAGYRTWQKLGRQVRRGAKAIHILAPVVRRAKEGIGESERIIGFKGACVFDVSQTEGKPLPEFARVEGDPGGQLERLRAFIRGRGIDLGYSDRLGAAEGAAAAGRIMVKAGLPPSEEFAVLAHELAHVALHVGERSRPDSKRVRETEAEAVAFVICEAVGLEARWAAADYITVYRGDRETLGASLERIQKTAAEIIDGLLEEGQSNAARTAEEGGRPAEPLPQDVKRLAA